MANGTQGSFEVRGNVVDLFRRRLFDGVILVGDGKITAVRELGAVREGATFLMPGFVDAHIHIESSMLVPTEFARLAVVQGTVGTVSDPHEIANVLGVKGIEFMLENAAGTALKVMFGAPPCVPATAFETAGARVTPEDVRRLLENPRVGYLAEVMNFPGVIAGDADLLAKIGYAKAAGKPCDGHAPGLRGSGVAAYFGRGITTDHECFTLEEALEKLEIPGVQILIREGSAAKNFEALHPLLRSHPERVMFCSDDKHPNDLEDGHINAVAARAVGLGYDVFDVLRAACVNPVMHFKMAVGLLRVGDAADFIEVKDLESFDVQRTWIDGELVAEDGVTLLPEKHVGQPNVFAATAKMLGDFAVMAGGDSAQVNVIEAFDGQLVTARVTETVAVRDGAVQADPSQDVLKMVVVNRYADVKPAVGFIRGFGMKRGAIASSVAHDSHNVVAVGATDEELMRAVNLVIGVKGGLAVVDAVKDTLLALPVGGIMTDRNGAETAAIYRRLDARARGLCDGGKGMGSPFMTLSFMALLVIPSLKLSDKGLFDGDQFQFVPVVEG